MVLGLQLKWESGLRGEWEGMGLRNSALGLNAAKCWWLVFDERENLGPGDSEFDRETSMLWWGSRGELRDGLEREIDDERLVSEKCT